MVQADKTTDATRDALLELCKTMKKTPVNCKDTPGWVFSRWSGTSAPFLGN